MFKALCCSMLVFIALAAIGIWLQRRRRGPAAPGEQGDGRRR